MRYILILLTFFISSGAMAQGIWQADPSNRKMRSSKSDSVHIVPRDTSAKNNMLFNGLPVGDSGRIAYQFGKFWGHDGTGWTLLGSQAIDTTKFIRNGTSPQTANYNITGNGTIGSTLKIATANPLAAPLNVGTLPSYLNLSAVFEGNIQTVPGLSDGHAVTLSQLRDSSRIALRKKPSRIFPYDSSYAITPSVPGASDIELINFGNTAHLGYPIYQNPMALWANNWAMGFGTNIQYDSVAKRYKIFNKAYPVSYYEAGWEGVTLHVVPANQADSVDLYPHEAFQSRPGLDGATIIDGNGQYNQVKATLAGRYDTSFNWQSTAYGWGFPKKPFMWYFSEQPTIQGMGNEYSSYDQYTSSSTSGAKFSFKRSRGTYASPTAVQSGDTLGGFSWFSRDGSSWLETGRIYGRATANATTNNAPTAMTIRASNGALAIGTATITSDGNFGVNTTSPGALMHLVREGFGGLLLIDRYTNGLGNLPPSIYGYAANGSISAPTGVKNNDRLITLNGSGHDGTSADRNSRGSLSISADADWTSLIKPTRFDVFLTSTVDDSRRVFSVDHNGRAAVGDTTDSFARLYVQGSLKAAAPTYSSGGYGIVVRNTTTGLYESVPSTTYAPAAANGYVELSPVSRQAGAFSLNTSSSIVSTGNAIFSIGQTTATPTNQAGIAIDGVDGNFIGADYTSLVQLQTGAAALRNQHTTGGLILGSGSNTAANITLSANNVTTFGGAVRYPITTVTGNTTLTAAHYTVLVNNSGSATITLPTASTVTGQVYVIKKLSAEANDVIISGASVTLTKQNSAVTVQSNGMTYYIIGSHVGDATL